MIVFQKFDDNFSDHYDMEKDSFIVYCGREGADFKIETQTQIKDFEGNIWNCMLWGVEYIPAMNTYELSYKAQ